MQVNQNSLLTEFSQRLAQHGVRSNTPAEQGQGPKDFADLLARGVSSVNNAQAESQDQIEQLLTGGDVNSAEVITSIQKADMAFRLLVQVRNKLMKAYEEIQAIHV